MKACKRYAAWLLVLTLLLQLLPAMPIAFAATTKELIEETYGSFNGEGVWITEIYHNDVDRSEKNNTRVTNNYEPVKLYESASDLMEYVEIISTHENPIKLNELYQFIVDGAVVPITDMNGNTDITLNKGVPVLLWNYRTDIVMPTEAEFRSELRVAEEAVILKATCAANWPAATGTFTISEKATGAAVSTFTPVRDTHTADGLTVELQVPMFKSSTMEVYRSLTLPTPGVVYAKQVRGMITAKTEGFDGKGVFITEIRPNDVNRSSSYGTDSDVMECFEITNTTDAAVNLNTDYQLVYTVKEGYRKVLKLYKYSSTAAGHMGSSTSCTVPAGGTAVIWCFREEFITDESSFPTLTKFRTAYGLDSSTPVYIFTNQNGLSNELRSLEVFKPDSNGNLGELVSRYSWLGSECTDGKSVHLQVNPEGPTMLVHSANTASTIGVTDSTQFQFVPDTGAAMTVKLYDGSTIPTSLMQGEDLRVWFYYKANGMTRTDYATYYRLDGKGDWIRSAEGGARVPNRYEAIVSGADLFDHDYVEFYVIMSNHYRDTLRGIYRVNIKKLNEVSGIRTNISQGEEVRGTVSITANDGSAANSKTKIYIDGVKQTTIPMLEDGAYVNFTITENETNRHAAITTTKNKVIHNISRWAYECLTNQVRHIDSSYFTYSESAGTYKVTLRFWTGNQGAITTDTLYPGGDRDDLHLSNLKLKLPNGKEYLPTSIGPKTYDGVDVTAKLNTSTALSAIHKIGDSASMTPYMNVAFTVPASEVNAVGVSLDTTTLSDGVHTLKVTNGTSTKEVTFIVDNTAPVVNMGFAKGEKLTKNIVLNPTLTEANHVNEFTVTLNGEVIQLPYETTAYSLGEGTHTVTVYATDAAGNSTTTTSTFVVDDISMTLTDAGASDITHSSAKLYLSAQSDAATNVTFYKAQRIDSAKIETGTTAGLLPYIQYTIDASNAQAGDDIVVNWNGTASNSDATHASNLFVRNATSGAWELVGSADAGGNIVNASIPVENHVTDGKMVLIVQCTADSALPDMDTVNDGITGNNADWDGKSAPADYDFSFAWITDTQYYVQKYNHHFINMNNWIVNNRESWKIKYVIHTGDIVDDFNAPQQWKNADLALKIFDDAGMPYGVLAGNHDVASGLNITENYYKYFPESRFVNQPTYGGSYKNNMGHYDLVSENGQDFIIVYMGWKITQEEVDWMNEVLAEHADRKAILCFHGYTHVRESEDGLLDYIGVMVRDQVVAKNPNVFAVLNGHYSGSVYQTVRFDDNDDGKLDRTVYQLCTDYQSVDEGGLEYIKFLYFDLDNDKVFINSYSPYMDDFNYYDTDAPDNLQKLAKNATNGVASNTDIDSMILKVDFSVDAQTILANHFTADLYTKETLGSATLNAATGRAELDVSGLSELTDYTWYAVLENENTGYLRTGLYDLTTAEAPCFHENHKQDGTCPDCGEVAQHSYESTVTDPTCTEMGCTTHTCTVCGLSYTDSEVPAIGHDYQTTTTAPSCTEEGKTEYVCTICGDSYSESIPSFGHSYGTAITPPSCTDNGFTTYTCVFCGASYTADEVDATGHSYDEGKVTTDPTCTEDGVKTYTCGTCGETKTESVAASGHSYVDGTCTACGAADPDYVKPVVKPNLTLSYPTLNFKDVVYYNVYYQVSDMTDVVEMGLITFDGALSTGTIDDAAEVITGYIASGSNYMVHTNGINAKNLGDALYFKVYAKLSDGSYVYSDLAGYHAVAYAKDILANSTNAKMKSLVVAMLNYGAAAQVQFEYKTDSLMNSFLTAEQKALVADYSADMVAPVTKVDSTKVGKFAYVSGGYSALYPSVSFEGAFSVKFYFTPAKAMDGDLTMYYWSAADYAAADVLTAENATGVFTMDAISGTYVATVEGIAARQIDETIYVAGIYESGGVSYPTGVIAYSLGTYCLDRVANGTGNMPAFAKATIVYGNYAKAYFA